MPYKYTLAIPQDLRTSLRRSAAVKGQTIGTYLLHTLYASQGMRVPMPAEFRNVGADTHHRSLAAVVEAAEVDDIDPIETPEERKARIAKEWDNDE